MSIDEFSDKWKDFPEIRDSTYEQQILSIMGVSSLAELRKLYKNGYKILDAGCGIGWTAVMYNLNPKTKYYLMDPSDSIDIAREYTKNMKNVTCTKSSIEDMNYQDFFNIIICNGVLHHTKDPVGNFGKLCTALKNRGRIGIYVYSKKPFIRRILDKEIRNITTNMNYDECKKFANQFAQLGASLSKIKEKLQIIEDIPLLNIKKGSYDLQKFIYNYFIKCYYNEFEGIEFSTIVNLDWYYPKEVHVFDIREILYWFMMNNIVDVVVKQPKGYENSGYFVSGRKSIG